MQNHGFLFRMVSRREYLLNSLKAIIVGPLSTYKIYREYKRSGEFPGLKKIINGIEISYSESLVVGTFSKL